MATNPIKTSDIFKDDGSLDALLQKLKQIELALAAIVGETKKLNTETKGLNVTNSADTEILVKKAKEQDELAKEMEKYLKLMDETNIKIQAVKIAQSELTKANKAEAAIKSTQFTSMQNYNAQLKLAKQRYDQLSEVEKESGKEGKKLESQVARLTARISEQRKAQREAVKVRELEIKTNNSAKGSYNQLSAQYSLIKIRLNAMSAESRKFTKEGQQLEAQSKSIYDEMKRLQEVTGKTSLNVGNYTEAIEDAGIGLSAFTGKIKIFLANPIVAVVAALAAGLVALGKAFLSTENGVSLMNRLTGITQGIFAQLTTIAQNLSDKIKFAFENPLEAIKGLGKSLVDNVVNRFSGLINLLQAVGKGIASLAKRDLEGLKEAGKDAAQAVLQIGTGLDSDEQERIKDEFNKLTNAVNDSADAFTKLKNAQRAVRLLNISLAESLENLITQEELIKQIRDDSTLSFKAQEDAAVQLEAIARRRLNLEIQIARNTLGVINDEIKLRKAAGQAIDDLLDARLSGIQQLRQAERDLLLFEKENDTIQRQLVQDRLERDLDILIDGFDNQKTINERIIQNENETLAARQALLDQTVILGEKSFKRQIETIQEFTDIQIDSNDLITESDAIALNEKIRILGLSEIIEGRLLEVIRDRKTAVLDLKDAQETLNDQTASLFDETDIIEANLKEIEDTIATFTDNIEKELDFTKADSPAAKRTIYDFLGISLENQGAYNTELKSAIDFAKQQVLEFARLQSELAQQAVDDSRAKQDALQSELQTQIELAQLGYANRVTQVQRELALQKKAQQEALENRKKAQQQELILQTIEQGSSLATSAAKLWGQFQLGAIPLIALMFGSFAVAKAKAFQIAAKQEFSEGGFDVIGGGRHSSGNDTFIGMTSQGKAGYAEQGEGRAIFNRDAMKKYGFIPNLVDSLNSGDFSGFMANSADSAKNPEILPVNINLSTTENELRAIRKQGEKKYTSSNGVMIENYKTLTRFYK